MSTNDYIRSLFKDYEETETLRDFMEELQSNLEARIASLVRKGLTEDEAFARAAEELGDISVLAGELSLKRRQEVFQDAYMGIKKYMTPRRVAAYLFFGAVLIFGIVFAIISGLSVADGLMTEGALPTQIRIEQPAAVLGVLLLFLPLSVSGLTFLGVTQETAAREPLSVKRALWYTLAAALIVFGVTLFALVYFTVHGVAESGHDRFVTGNTPLIGALTVTIPFCIPGLALLIFLCLTEKNRLKPWAMKYRNAKIKESMETGNSRVETARFGLFSGAIWFAALGLFFVLELSWLVFIFAAAIQLLIQGLLCKPKNPAGDQKEDTKS